MALIRAEFHAPTLGKAVGLNAIVPDCPGPLPVLYLLHGLGDDHTTWARRSSIERYVDRTNLIVVMPDAQRSFYANDPRPGGLRWEDYLISDVVGFCDRVLPTRPERTGRGVAGLSMGGYGAVMLALRHPEMFAAGCSHSGALAFAEYDAPEGAADVVAVLTDALDRETYSCFALAETVERRGPVPTLRIDCGTDDFLIEHSRGLHAHLDAIGVGHEYAEHPGAHNWTYWDRHIPDTLEFILPILGIEGSLTP